MKVPICAIFVAMGCAACGSASETFVTRDVASWRGIVSGTVVEMVVIVSSQCEGARSKPFAAAIRLLADSLGRRAQRAGKRFAVIGVSLDVRLDAGLEILSELRVPFNEVTVGSSWLNNAAQTFIWTTVPGIAGVPQVVVVERRVTVSPNHIGLEPYDLIARMVGEAEIETFLRTPINRRAN